MDGTLKHPFTCLLAGPTQSGKSTFAKRMIRHASELIHPTPEEIIWYFSEWQDGYTEIKGVTFREGLPTMEEFADKKRRLIVLDDLMEETDKRVTALFTKGSHHNNVSIIHIVQNVFSKNKEHRTLSLNSHYMILFKNPRDASQIQHLANQMYPNQTKYVLEAYKDAVSVPHGYLFVDLTQDTPDHLRLKTSIFPGEIQTAYVPK